MHKIISLLLTLFMGVATACADPITKTINSLNVNKGGVSVSVRDVKTGNNVYSLNSDALINPASTLKLITFASSVDTLGFDYEFFTRLYKSTNNDLYLKLSGDPFLTSSNLETLMKDAKDKNIITPKNIYIDSTVFDNNNWGEGWQWDDDLNPLMPKFSAYNLDKNILNIIITANGGNVPPTIAVKPFYPLTFMNAITTDVLSKENNVSFTRDSNIYNIIKASGTISTAVTKNLPVPNPRVYFLLRLKNAINNAKIEYYNNIKNAKLPDKNIYLVSEVSHDMSEIGKAVLKNSNNAAAETVFKMAGSVWTEDKGTTENSLKMLESYLKNVGLDIKDVTIVDGSGVSKNNLMSANFMTKFLVALTKDDNFETYKEMMVSPGEGTLTNRMLYFKDNLRAKTGTLFGISAIAGYITTRKGKNLAFDIMINDSKASSYDKKNLEEQILRQIYMSY